MDFQHWKQYYEANRTHFGEVDWNQADELSADEKTLITTSLQQFQKGESSEGRHLLAFARQQGDPIYLHCIKLFIAEEQRHALVLGRYMEQKGIPRIRRHWVDAVFRSLRKAAGLENSIRVLLTAVLLCCNNSVTGF